MADAGPDTTLRIATDADTALLRELTAELHDAIRATAPFLPPADTILDAHWRWLMEQLATCGGAFLLAELNGEPIGHACVLVNVPPDEPDEGPEPSARLLEVYVREAARGHGTGRRLVEAAERFARDAGATAIRLGVTAGNGPARALYESMGYAAEVLRYAKPL